jgi:hypothetical protein
MNHLRVPVRTAAVSFGTSGLLVAASTPWHPDIFARPVDEVVRSFEAWTLLHLLLMVAVVLALIGAAGLVAAHAGRLGPLGQLGLLVTVVGVVAAASVTAIEAVVFPVLAHVDPTLLALTGPLLTSPVLVALGILALAWPIGLALLGLAAARSHLFPRTPGVLLALSAPLFLALAGPFVPVLGLLSAVAFGAAQLWWALLLWRSTSTHDRTREG